MSKPKVIKAGKYPDCVHHEQINGGLIGICCKCGQVKDYQMPGIDSAVHFHSPGDATLEQVLQSRSKGGKASKKPTRGLPELIGFPQPSSS